MKNFSKMILATLSFALLLSGCSKEAGHNDLSTGLLATKSALLKAYQTAKSYDDSLIMHVNPSGQFSYPGTMMEDSLYHLNDSLCNEYYQTYCNDMMSGSSMMGNGMMGRNMQQGSNMMTGNTYMGDTALVNQTYRDLNVLRRNHAAHHPVTYIKG
jgi:hypothetical protein